MKKVLAIIVCVWALAADAKLVLVNNTAFWVRLDSAVLSLGLGVSPRSTSVYDVGPFCDVFGTDSWEGTCYWDETCTNSATTFSGFEVDYTGDQVCRVEIYQNIYDDSVYLSYKTELGEVESVLWGMVAAIPFLIMWGGIYGAVRGLSPRLENP